jgi:enterochelin esterase family protein
MIRLSALSTLLLLTFGLAAQTPAPKPFLSHQVNADHTLTFRMLAPTAKSLSVSIDAFPKPLPMTREENGVWSVTTPVLPPEYYGYSFNLDGHSILDPLNSHVRPSLTSGTDIILVPGTPSAPWELAAIPHGRVDAHVYTSHAAVHLPVDQESYVVYTPPGYDTRKKGGYPVLYLLHGWSDDQTGWTAVGHANDILDSLIDSGKAVPMIVVMPLGYGDYDFVTHGFSIWNDKAKVDANTASFTSMLAGEIMPAVEREYNTAAGRDNRAIAGLSMGGLESLSIGLTHTSDFAWIGGMSSAIHNADFNVDFDQAAGGLTPAKANLRLLWVACGTGDRLITPNRAFVAWAKTKGLPITAVETPGAHTWLVWRDNLLHFAPLLFKGKE